MAAQANKKFKKTFKEIQLYSLENNSKVIPFAKGNLKGRLSLVTTPIGEYYDITFRALRTLEEAEFLVCEDTKETSKLLRFFGIKKELNLLNEHNEDDAVRDCLTALLSGVNVTLVSDCGTPAFADPGLKLVNECIKCDIEIDFIHGSNSVISAISISGFDTSRFYFYGFLSPKKEIRNSELKSLTALPHPVILMDTPYRLINLMNDLSDIFPERNVFLAMNLSTRDEKQLRGKPSEILNKLKNLFGDLKPKAEFIVVVDKTGNRQ